MKTSRTIILSAVLTLGLPPERAIAADGWGASWSFGPTTSRIVHAKTTIVPGRLPPITSTTGPLFLWPGMSNPTSDLIQTTMDVWPDNKGYCGAATGQWCVEASVFGSFGQRNGPTVAIDPDDHVTIEYVLGADDDTWTQTVTSQKLGMVVSTLQSTSGLMPKGGFGFATEADADSFTIDTQYYLCTELDLADADPHFGATGVGGVGAQHGATGKGSGIGTAKNVRTPDGGLTWLVDLVTLPAMQPQGTQTPPPEISCGGTDGGAGGSTSTSGSTRGSTSGASAGSSTVGATSATSGSAAGTRSSGAGTAATGSGGSSSGIGGASASSGASTSGDTAADAAAGRSETSGCSCAFVGGGAKTDAGLSIVALGLAAPFARRRRKTRKA
jgi:MYXO-CTERM domain-containing protein